MVGFHKEQPGPGPRNITPKASFQSEGKTTLQYPVYFLLAIWQPPGNSGEHRERSNSDYLHFIHRGSQDVFQSVRVDHDWHLGRQSQVGSITDRLVFGIFYDVLSAT